jgi:hypothetical protein
MLIISKKNIIFKAKRSRAFVLNKARFCKAHPFRGGMEGRSLPEVSLYEIGNPPLFEVGGGHFDIFRYSEGVTPTFSLNNLAEWPL